MGKQVVLSDEVYSELLSLKIHPREPFNDVVKRLLQFYKAHYKDSSQSSGGESR